jgi:F0F1-type ATP synthase membrane subunit c/vacuolar-type H+-ATPase subunit K
MAWQRRNAPTAALAGVLLASAVVLLYLARDFTFIQDTWNFLLERRGSSLDTFFEPHNEHIVVLPVVIEKVLIAVFGMTSALPERLVLTAMLVATAALVFVYVRRRVGPWPAVIAAALLSFLGPSWTILMWPFQTVIVGSVLCGVGALLMLDRNDRAGDAWACVLLVLSVLFSAIGVSFALGAAVDVLVRRRERGLFSRAYVAVVPLLVYAAWYLGWGHEAQNYLSLNNVLHSPVYLIEGFASSIDSLLGLSTIDVNDVGEPAWGRPLLIAAVGLVIWGYGKGRSFSPRLWPVLAAAASYWLLAGFNYFAGRPPVAGRYGYAGAVFVLLIAADLLKGVRFSRNALLIGGAVTVFAVAANLTALRDGRDWLENLSVLTKADTAAIEIAERTVPEEFRLTPEIAGTGSLIAIEAGSYLDAVRDEGSPAYTPAELLAAPGYARRQADIVLGQALPVSTEAKAGVYGESGGADCQDLASGEEFEVQPGVTRIEVAPGPHADFSLRRFASGEYPVKTEGADGDSTVLLTIPQDKSTQPWFLQVEAAQPVRVCG